MTKEAKARIKINKLLEEAGWRFEDDNNIKANIKLEENIKFKDCDNGTVGARFIILSNGNLHYGTVESQIIFYFICHFWYKFLLFLAKYVQYVSKNSQNFFSKLAKN